MKAVANMSAAPGARSCTISSMAVPSVPEPAWPASTVTSEGRSPEAWTAASESTPSERTPTVMPVPSTPRAARSWAVRWATSPAETLVARV